MKWIWAGLFGLCLLGCVDVDNHVHPVTISADPESIYTGETTKLTWSSPGGLQVLSSNFGTHEVSGYMYVSPSSTTEYRIKVRLASNDIYTAKVTVNVSDPPDDGGGDDGSGEEQKTSRKPTS